MPVEPEPSIAYPPADVPPVDLERFVALRDFEEPARDRIHPVAWAYIDRGAEDQRTFAHEQESWDGFRLRPRVLVDVSDVRLDSTILGRRVSMPVGIAPAALHGLCHADSELATARAAASAGVPMVLSTLSSRSLEAVAAAAPEARRWFQLYVQAAPDQARSLVERAAVAGYEAIVLTVDVPLLGYRDDVLRDRFNPGPEAFGNLEPSGGRVAATELDNVIEARSAPLTWESLAEIRSWSPLPLVLKGVLTPEDARLAVEHGVDAVWVSTHGGRQLDRVVTGVEAIEAVLGAVNRRAEVYLDGGIRRGTQVVIALALGARAVFTARPFLWALACAGQPGVEKALSILGDEVSRAMSLLGAPTVDGVRRDHVATRVDWPRA